MKLRNWDFLKIFNRVNIKQTVDSIKFNNTTYIDELLAQHHWLSDNDTQIHVHPLPMNLDIKYQLRLEQTEIQSMIENLALENHLKFTYCQVFGDILCNDHMLS